MELTNQTLTVLWLGAGAVALWMLLPAVLNALGLTLRRSVIEDNPSAVEPTGDDAEYEDLVGQLRRLGFEPVGRRTTTCWLFLHHWYRRFEARVFAAREGDCIAKLYKLRTWDPWRLCFATAFSDGAIVETANQMASFKIDVPEHRRWGLATPDRGLLLERHREVCRDFAAAGARSISLLPAEQVNQCAQYHESRYHRRHHRLNGLRTMAASLCWLAAGLVLIRRLGDNTPFLFPVSIFAWGLLWPAVYACRFRAAAGASRAADARQANQQASR
ncbi:MAG TPA: hypothetical protein VG125_00970, partial [Pirellulales bacterium]|nr:hypothetical protein [Pirellulales bacterium]